MKQLLLLVSLLYTNVLAEIAEPNFFPTPENLKAIPKTMTREEILRQQQILEGLPQPQPAVTISSFYANANRWGSIIFAPLGFNETPQMRFLDRSIAELNDKLDKNKRIPPISFEDFNAVLLKCLAAYRKELDPRLATMPKTLYATIYNSKNQFICQKKKLTGSRPYNVCFIGDIHGSWYALMTILNDLKNKGYIDDNFKIIKPDFYIVFLGDLVDRGMYGAEVLYTLMKFKLANWDQVFVLRGNHEDLDQCDKDGFIRELETKYGKEPVKSLIGNRVKDKLDGTGTLDQLFSFMPQVLYLGVGFDVNTQQPYWIQCCHGGMFKPSEELAKQYEPSNFLQDQKNLFIVNMSPSDLKPNEIEKPSYSGFTWCNIVGKIPQQNIQFNQQTNEQYVTDGTPVAIISKKRSGIGGMDVGVTKGELTAMGLSLLCRGHQHNGESVKMISPTMYQKRDDLTLDMQVGEPVSWKQFVQPGTRNIQISNVECPVFTFTTAWDLSSMVQIGYGLLATVADISGWTLTPVILKDKRSSVSKPVVPVKSVKTSTSSQVSQLKRPTKPAPLPTVTPATVEYVATVQPSKPASASSATGQIRPQLSGQQTYKTYTAPKETLPQPPVQSAAKRQVFRVPSEIPPQPPVRQQVTQPTNVQLQEADKPLSYQDIIDKAARFKKTVPRRMTVSPAEQE